MRKKRLMTPGPTSVPPEVLQSQSRPMIHHRTPEFEDAIRSSMEGLKEIYKTNQSDILIFSSSGTGAMESAIVNCLSFDDTVLVCHNGKFGERMCEISQAYKLNVIELEYEWNVPVNVEDVRTVLDENPDIRAVVVTHSETSSGVLNDIESIGKLVSEYPNAITIVDAISSLGSANIETDEWCLDVVIAGSQKGLMLPPGLAMVSVSEKAWQAVNSSDLPKFYFDWTKAQASAEKNTTPFTPAVSLVLGLNESIKLFADEGIDNVIARHERFASATQHAVEALGLEIFPPKGYRSPAVTVVKAPEGVDGQDISSMMKNNFGITIAGGQSQYKGKIFRLGHLGYTDAFDVVAMIDALEQSLSKLGYSFNKGAGINAANKILFSEEQ